MTVDQLIALGQSFGPLGLMIGYLVWRELRTEMEQRLRAVRTQPPAPASSG